VLLESIYVQATAIWELVARQHGVITRAQLLAHGLTPDGIRHRIERGRLWPIWRGVYAVGRRSLDRHGMWMACVLACGEDASLSHRSALALWGARDQVGPTHISVPVRRNPTGRDTLVVHRRDELVMAHVTERFGIPVTSVLQTMIDEAVNLEPLAIDRLINEADRLELMRADDLRAQLGEHRGRSGVRALRSAIDAKTFFLNRSALEKLFVPLARRAGLEQPQANVYVNGVEVDFWWPQLRLVIETDGLRYHRTPAQQEADRKRDQLHQAAGDYSLRFTHAQVRFEPAYVERILRSVAANIKARLDADEGL